MSLLIKVTVVVRMWGHPTPNETSLKKSTVDILCIVLSAQNRSQQVKSKNISNVGVKHSVP